MSHPLEVADLALPIAQERRRDEVPFYAPYGVRPTVFKAFSQKD